MKAIWPVAALLCAACGGGTPAPAPLPGGAAQPPLATGRDVLQRMHDAYAGRWYETLTFVQKTTFPDGRVETWHEAMRLPGLLRIDVAPVADGKTSLFRNDSIYTFEGGRLVRAGPLVHPLMVLGFDVYGAPVEETARKLEALGFDLEPLARGTWQGRPVHIVGAEAGDSVTPQFWVDAERLVFVRLIERRPAPQGSDAPAVRIETQFNDYRPLAGGWIAPEVLFLVNGAVRLREEYRDMRADVDLPDGTFDPSPWSPPAWVRE